MKELPPTSSAVFADLESGLRAEHQPREALESASLVKLPILVELYRRAEAGELKLSEEMTLEDRFRVEGSGLLKDQPSGTKWSLEKLASLMVAESDNVATDMLLERLGLETLTPAMRKLGLKETTVERTVFDFAAIDAGRDNRTSAADTALLLEKMGKGELPGSEAMLAILETTRRRDMLPAKLPKGVKVAHKTGELTGVLHDAGLVTAADGRRYVLVLLSQGFPERDAQLKAWATLSGKVYAEYTRD